MSPWRLVAEHEACGAVGDHRDVEAVEGIWCDPCIAQVVKALNEGGLRTIASCCGHGAEPPSVALADGRWLVIYDDTDLRVDGTIRLPAPPAPETPEEPAGAGQEGGPKR